MLRPGENGHEDAIGAEAALRASEARYRAVFDAIDQAFHRCEVITDATGRAVDYRLLEVNPAWSRMTGLAAADAVGRTARELVPDAPAEWIEACGRAGLGRENVRLEQEIPALGMWYDVHLVPFGERGSREFLATAADITARKHAETERACLAAQVAAERERLRSVILQTPGPLALLEGPEHRFALVNDAYKRVSGGGRDVTGLTPPEAFPELAGSGIHELFDRVYETGEPWVGPETRVRYDRDGTGVQDTWFDLRLEPLRDAEGRVTAVFNFAVDVTEQVRARREVEGLLAESERARRQMAATLESIADAFYAVDAEFRFTYVNRKAEELWGRPRETLVGRHYWTEFPQAVGSEPYHRHLAAMAERRPAHFEVVSPIIGRWIEASLYPDEATGGLACYFRDVTERKAVEARLREAEERYLALFTAMDQGFCTLEVRFDAEERAVDYRFLEVSPSFERQTGIRNGEGRWMRDIAPDQDAVWFERYCRVALTGEPERFEEHSTPLGRWWSVYAFRVADPALRRVGVLFHDITDRKHAEAERERLLRETEGARREAEAANRTKSEFLAVMSHELRTPLNAIGGYAELMEMGIRGPVTAEQREDLRRLQASQRHLLGLINEVLNYAKLETGAVHYDVTAVCVRDALGAAEALVAPQAQAKGLTLAVAHCPPTLAVRADAEKLRQVLANLLSNAVKFTDRGGRITLAGTEAAERVHVTVQDTGIGIPADQCERIFDPFVQVRADLTRTAEGTGLGLAISRDLARGMGGDLTVESEPGVGSTFTLMLPTA